MGVKKGSFGGYTEFNGISQYDFRKLHKKPSISVNLACKSIFETYQMYYSERVTIIEIES